MLRALLLAPPGAGKGTQGKRLAEVYGVSHFATGDLLRQHVAEGTELGLQAKEYIDRGELVPDRLVVDLVASRLGGKAPPAGFVLDGFPRTLAQAKEAYEWGRHTRRTFHAVISLEVPEDELVRRLLERGRQTGRSDDNEETIRKRLAVYEAETQPLLDFYRGRGILLEIDGLGSVAEVTARIQEALGPLDVPSRWIVHRFSQANPRGPNQANFPALLRRLAATMEQLGPVDVEDVTFSREVTPDGPRHRITVYLRPHDG